MYLTSPSITILSSIPSNLTWFSSWVFDDPIQVPRAGERELRSNTMRIPWRPKRTVCTGIPWSSGGPATFRVACWFLALTCGFLLATICWFVAKICSFLALICWFPVLICWSLANLWTAALSGAELVERKANCWFLAMICWFLTTICWFLAMICWFLASLWGDAFSGGELVEAEATCWFRAHLWISVIASSSSELADTVVTCWSAARLWIGAFSGDGGGSRLS